jgi:putative two-component system response regulator
MGLRAFSHRTSRADKEWVDPGLLTSPSRPEAALVVDDERAVRELIARILDGSGYRPVIASSGHEAISHVEDQDFAVVLTDINMPGSISGLDLIEELHARRPSLPIILVTGSVEEETVREALDRGAAGFITKPFRPAELREKVAAVHDRARLAEGDLRERALAPTVASVLANAIEVRDASMEGHTERLAALALELGRRKSLSESDLESLGLGAVLHDIGKIGIPDGILMKPGRLTDDERAAMQAHTEIGDRMLEPVHLLGSVRPVVRHHHERWDGAGYPDGLAGAAIPLLARIVSVADSIEAMSGDRPYRRPLRRDDVVRELEEGRGSQWDPELVDVALDLIAGGRLRFGEGGMTLLEEA